MVSVLFHAHLCTEYSLDSSNFLEEIFSLSHFRMFAEQRGGTHCKPTGYPLLFNA